VLPIVTIAGHSKSGKTTLIERLIAELKRRGRRVAVVKHTCEEFDMDRPGKDTWRYAQAGCESVAILGPQRSAVLKRHERRPPLEEVMLAVGGEADLVLVEGFHDAPAPKIEVHRSDLGRGLRCDPEDLLAVVTDEPLEVDCRRFSPDEIGAIADFIEEKIVSPASGGTELLVNGDPVPLRSFAQQIIARTVVGMVSSLKGVDEIRSVSVSIRTETGAPRKREAPEPGIPRRGD
jgi:molybdopterin-guanine dinucleotide biosynthesis protein B